MNYPEFLAQCDSQISSLESEISCLRLKGDREFLEIVIVEYLPSTIASAGRMKSIVVKGTYQSMAEFTEGVDFETIVAPTFWQGEMLARVLPDTLEVAKFYTDDEVQQIQEIEQIDDRMLSYAR